MRVPGAYATAVRDPQGNIQIDRHEFKSIIEIYPFLKKPLLRGVLGLFESLKIGYSTLQWSAEISLSEEENSKEPSRLVDILLTLFSFGLALGFSSTISSTGSVCTLSGMAPYAKSGPPRAIDCLNLP